MGWWGFFSSKKEQFYLKMGPVSWSTSFSSFHCLCCVIWEEVHLFGFFLQPGSFTPPEDQMRAEMLTNATSSAHIKAWEQVMSGRLWMPMNFSYLESRKSRVSRASDWPWVTLQNPCWVEKKAKDLTHGPTGCTFISLKPFQFCFLSAQSRSGSSALNHQ